jgi:tetratricopeptide (TPR) repeat protein
MIGIFSNDELAALFHRGQFRVLENRCRRIVKGLRRTRAGGEALLLAWALEDLGFVFHMREAFQRAFEEYSEALGIYRQCPNDMAIDVIRCQCELGRLGIRMGQTEKAEALLVEALASVRRVPDEERASLPAILINLATLHRNRHDFASAHSLLIEALRLRVKHYHWKHPKFAVVLHHLSRLYWQMGLERAAARTLAKAMRILEEGGHAATADYASMLQFRAQLDESQGRVMQAIERTRAALAILREVRPQGDRWVKELRQSLRELGMNLRPPIS